jgi:hypothetical protein
MDVEDKQQTALQRTINRELEWIRSNAKGQQKKGKVWKMMQHSPPCTVMLLIF